MASAKSASDADADVVGGVSPADAAIVDDGGVTADDIALRGPGDESSVASEVPDTRSSGRGRMCKAKHLFVIGGLAFVAVAVFVVMMISTRASSNKVQVPHTFSANLRVEHKAETTEAPYTGVIHKTQNENGAWVVSARMTLSSNAEDASEEPHTVVTYLDDRAYFQLVDRDDGEVVGAGCLTAANIPPIADLADGMAEAVPVDDDHVKSDAVRNCNGQDKYAIQWYGQTYVLCADQESQSYAGAGLGFDATLFNINTSPDGNPITVPLNISGVPLSCEPLGIADDLADATKTTNDGRLLRATTTGGWNAGFGLHPWYEKGFVTERNGRVLHGGGDGDECCNCRRRRLYTDDITEGGEIRTAPMQVAHEPAPAAVYEVDTLSDDNVIAGTSKKHSADKQPHEFCICCMLAGLESPSWNVPNICETTIKVDIGATADWDDTDAQQRLCEQLDVDGDGYIDTMSIFGVSSGNYMLAAAIDNGYCKLDRAVNDVVWNVIEGLARQNPDKFCSTLDDPSGKKKRGGGIKAWIKHKKAWKKLMKRRRAWAHVCESFNDNGRTRYRPRPSFSKMGGNDPHLNKVVDLVDSEADVVVKNRRELDKSVRKRKKKINSRYLPGALGQFSSWTIANALGTPDESESRLTPGRADTVVTTLSEDDIAAGTDQPAYYGSIAWSQQRAVYSRRGRLLEEDDSDDSAGIRFGASKSTSDLFSVVLWWGGGDGLDRPPHHIVDDH